jgi:hypothetical protein
MGDLFRGFDLTTMVDTVAEKQFERMLEQARRQGVPDDQMVAWDDLAAVDKRNYKEQFLPIVTDLLDAIESLKAPDQPLIDRRDMAWWVSEVAISREEAITLLASGEARLTDRAALHLSEEEDGPGVDMLVRAAADLWDIDQGAEHYSDEDRARLRAQLDARGA